jgi:hypothetical protein
MTIGPRTIVRILLTLSMILLVADPNLVRAKVDTRREDQLLKTAMNYIEANRKGTTEIRLIDNMTGLLVSGAQVKYQQISHDFIFGAQVLPWGWGTPDMMTNLGLEWSGDVGLNWAQIEPSHGVFNFRETDTHVGQLLQSGLRLWGGFHGLLLDWNSLGWAPPQPPSYSGFDKISDPAAFEQYKQFLHEFVFQVVSHYRGKFSGYRTQLEVNWPSVVIRTGVARAPVWTIQQAVEVEKVTAKAIQDADPKAIVILATSTIEPVDAQHLHRPTVDVTPIDFTRLCIRSGVDFDMVALEVYPMDGSPASYYDYVRSLAALGKPVFVNESGYPSSKPVEWIGSQSDHQGAEEWVMSWKWHVFDEHTQALWCKYLFTLLFGLKGVAGVNLWLVRDLEDGVAGVLLFKNMGVYDVNGHLKESGVVLRNLIMNFTTDETTTTDVDGRLALRGFAGNYTVNVEGYEPFIVHVPEAVTINSTITLIPKKTQFSTTTTTSTSLSTTAISQQTAPFEGPPGLYLIPLAVVFVTLVVATVLWSRRRK